MVLWFLGLFVFLTHFLDLKKTQPFKYKIIYVFCSANFSIIIFTIIMLLLDQSDKLKVFWYVGYINFLIIIATILWSTIVQFEFDRKSAIYVLISFFPHFFWGAIVILNSFQIVPINIKEDWFLKFGTETEKLDYNLFVTSNYENSLKEGEEIVKTENDSIICVGINMQYTPFNGKFITINEMSNDRPREISNFVNYKQEGLQQVLNSDNKLIESYYIKDGLKEGIYTIINDNVKFEMMYKNDLPYEGIWKLKNSETIYKKGLLVSETEFNSDNPEEFSTKTEYENGEISKITSNKFTVSDIGIIEENQYVLYKKTSNNEIEIKGFIGVYKDEKPYNGYFENEKNEFKIVSFYKNGELINTFSKNWFNSMSDAESRNTYLDLKSIYKNGKIVDGYQYLNYGKIMAIKKYEKEVLKALDVNFFEMHYYNRLHYEIKNNLINITELQHPDIKIVVSLEENITQQIMLKTKKLKQRCSRVLILTMNYNQKQVLFICRVKKRFLS